MKQRRFTGIYVDIEGMPFNSRELLDYFLLFYKESSGSDYSEASDILKEGKSKGYF